MEMSAESSRPGKASTASERRPAWDGSSGGDERRLHPQSPPESPIFRLFLGYSSQESKAWAGGDFNLIYRAEDKNNSNLNRAMMGRLWRFIDDCEQKEIPLIGCKFTWSNEWDNLTIMRLDRAFCCSEWEDLFPEAGLQNAASGISDHCPLTLSLNFCPPQKRRFHFESFWPQLPECFCFKLQRLSRGCKSGVNVK